MLVGQTAVAGLLQITLLLYLAGGLAGFWPGQWADRRRRHMGAALCLSRRRLASRISHGLALLAGLTGAFAAASVLLLPGRFVSLTLPLHLPLSTNALTLDTLSAFFVLVITLGSVSAALYAPSYLQSYEEHKPVGWLAAGYNFFVLSMLLVVTAGDLVLFLVAWEVMSTLSYLLVMTDHEQPAVRHAGFVYLVMTHAGTAFITGAFLILMGAAGTTNLTALTAGTTGLAGLAAASGGFPSAAASLSPALRSLVFFLLLAGFGTKAGLIPLHVWLPRAHPAAPSHVSALMSGVMVKTAVYGILRFVFVVLAGGPLWWGAVLTGLGLVSAILGVLYALMEADLKRLLAFSTIENIGIILTGLGAALLARGMGLAPLAAALAAAALLHTLNHALFKGLLFEAVGSIHHATHSRNLEHLGGLIRSMPQTALLFLGGTFAIAALPPSNGFLSELLILKGLIHLGAAAAAPPSARLAALLAATGLAFTGALAAAAFVKAFGISFLGQPRSEAARSAREAPAGMRLGMGLLLVLSVLIGLVPGPALALVEAVGAAATPAGVAPASAVTQGLGTLTPVLAISIALTGLLAVLIARVWSRGRPVRVTDPWSCGVDLEPDMQYSGAALVKPLRIFFRSLLQPDRSVTREDAGSPYFPTVVRYEASIAPVYERYLYQPFRHVLLAVSNRLRRIQTGSVQAYLAYIAATLALLLVLAR